MEMLFVKVVLAQNPHAQIQCLTSVGVLCVDDVIIWEWNMITIKISSIL